MVDSTRTCLGAVFLACLTCTGILGARAKLPSAAPAPGPFGVSTTDTWDTFDADVSVSQSFIDPAGHPTRPAPPAVRFRLERTLQKTGWRTSMTLTGVDQAVVHAGDGLHALDSPFIVSRMEYDDNGTTPRFYNGAGQQIAGVSAADRALVAVPAALAANSPTDAALDAHVPAPPVPAATRDWITNIIATPDRLSARRQAIERRYGKPIARVGGLDEYLATKSPTTYEMLVTPDTVVSIEADVVRTKSLVSHMTMGYTPYTGGVLARERLHGEHISSPGSTERAVTDLALAHITLSRQVSR
jgi:hypothetical protein